MASEFAESLGAMKAAGIKMLPALALALVGATVRWLRAGGCDLRSLCIGMATGAFAGVLTFLWLQDVALAESLKGALVGLSGFAGGDLLQAVTRRACREVEGRRK